jgi:hypothetical protein
VLGAVVALIGLTGIADVAHWWHASAIFVPLMSRDAASPWRRPVWATVGFLVWATAMRFVWLDRPLGLVNDLRHVAGGLPATRSGDAHFTAASTRSATRLSGATCVWLRPYRWAKYFGSV